MKKILITILLTFIVITSASAQYTRTYNPVWEIVYLDCRGAQIRDRFNNIKTMAKSLYRVLNAECVREFHGTRVK